MAAECPSSHKVRKNSILNQNQKTKRVTGHSYKAFSEKECTQIASDAAPPLGRPEILSLYQSLESKGDFLKKVSGNIPRMGKGSERTSDNCSKACRRAASDETSVLFCKRKRVENLNSNPHETLLPENSKSDSIIAGKNNESVIPDDPIGRDGSAAQMPTSMVEEPMKETSSVDLQSLEKGAEGNSRNPVTENENAIKSICEQVIASLKDKHRNEIKEFHRMWKWKRVAIEHEHKKESAQICSTNNRAVTADKLKELDKKIASRMNEHKLQMNKSLEDLKGMHNLEKNEEVRKAVSHLLPLECSEMCNEDDEGNNDSCLQFPTSNCEISDFGESVPELSPIVSESPSRNIHNVEERGWEDTILREESDFMRMCIQSEARDVDEPVIMETEVDQVEGGSVDDCDPTMVSMGPGFGFPTQISDGVRVHSSVPVEEVPNAARLEAAAPATSRMPPDSETRQFYREQPFASPPVARNQTDLARVLNVPPRSSYSEDPLRIDFERLCRENECNIQHLEATKMKLKSDEENEIAEIKRKYETRLDEVEIEFLTKKQEIDMKCMIVGMNRTLALASRLTTSGEPDDSVQSLQQPMPPPQASAIRFPIFQHPAAPPHSQNVHQSPPLLPLFELSPAGQSSFRLPTELPPPPQPPVPPPSAARFSGFQPSYGVRSFSNRFHPNR